MQQCVACTGHTNVTRKPVTDKCHVLGRLGRYYGVEERIELWGLQIPHNSVRPQLAPVDEGTVDKEDKKEEKEKEKDVITWTSVSNVQLQGSETVEG